MRDDQQDGGREGGEADDEAASHGCSPGLEDQAMGMIGVAALTAMAAKNSAPANERAMR
ncbi:MAG TPA: hypothetical protein VNJ10_02655 [Sphingomonas sp.]|nr:hypothetical protein [Sphingomonas sp.]